MRPRIVLCLFLTFPFLTGWGLWAPAVKIGVSLDHAQGREILVKKLREELEENRADLLLTDAKDDPKAQENQVKDLIAQGIQALIVLPADPSKAAPLVSAAHKADIKVLSLDRLIPHSGLDYLVAFNPSKTGALQSHAMTDRVPKGNYLLLGNNGLREGWMKGLKTSLDRGDIQIAASLSSGSQGMVRTQLKKGKKIAAILAADERTASWAAQALEAEGLLGKVAFAGTGEDLETCRRIVAGTQAMTVYDPPQKLAEEAAYLAAKLARKAKEFDCQFTEMDEGGAKTLAVLLTPLVVDAKNLDSTILKDGVQKKEDVYRK